MTGSVNHMVAKLRWNTVFDRSEYAIELQNRISAWSNTRMPGNISKVFDKFCPETQTWKIESLDLDLGKIDLENLEAELDRQLHTQLNQKLIDLMVNGNRDHLKIDVEENQSSQLQAFRYFLLYGAMPWNYGHQNRSINELVAIQLRTNVAALTDVLRTVAKHNMEVRKRLAWQLNINNLTGIVKGLEPAHHEQVIDFSNEMIRIKVNEHRIQGSTLDFKKNLWFWIFNYLLAKRGSLFNKIAFLKSNIAQMAAHYSISYRELLRMIKTAVKEVSVKKFVKHELLTIVDQLSGEEETLSDRIAGKRASEIWYWSQLSWYFSNPNATLNRTARTELNDLVINLSKADPMQFAVLVATFVHQEKWVGYAASHLNIDALEEFFMAFKGAGTVELLRDLKFLIRLNPEIRVNIKPQAVWEMGLNYLNLIHKMPPAQKNFMEFYLAELTKKGLKKSKIREMLWTTPVSVSLKNVANIAAYAQFKAALTEKSELVSPLVSIRELITKVLSQWKARPANPEKMERLSRELLKGIRQNPKVAWQALIGYDQKEALEQVFSSIIDQNTAALLLQNAAGEDTSIFSVWFSAQLIRLGVETLLFQSNLLPVKRVEYLFLKIKHSLPLAYSNAFERFIYAIQMERHPEFVRLDALANGNKKTYSIRQLIAAVEMGEHRTLVSARLNVALKQQEYTLSDLQKHPKRNQVLNYLLNNGVQVQRLIFQEYSLMLSSILPKNKLTGAIKQIDKLFWICVLNDHRHYGNKQNFRKLYLETIQHHFKLKRQINPAQKRVSISMEKSAIITLNNSIQMNADQLFVLLKNCLHKSSDHAFWEGTKLSFTDLFLAALEQDLVRLKSLINSFSISKSRIRYWSSNVSFHLFLERLIGSKNAHLKPVVAWFNITEHLFDANVPQELVHDFWSLLLMVLKYNRLPAAQLKKNIQLVLFRLSALKGYQSVEVINGIKDSEIGLPKLLADVLATALPNFSALKSAESKSMEAEKLLKTDDPETIYEWSKALICQKQTPLWYRENGSDALSGLVHELLIDHPNQFFQVLKRENVSEAQYIWLKDTVNFKALIKTIGNLNRTQRTNLAILQDFYFSLGNLANPVLSGHEMQLILFKKLIKAWLNGNWKILTAEYIWHELIWEISLDKKIGQKQLIETFIKIKVQLPPSLQITLSQIAVQQQENHVKPKKELIKRKDPEFLIADGKDILKDSIYVQNAGLVLINHYIPMLFERLGLINGQKEYLPEKQLDAVHYLQYVATGLLHTEEPDLVLNKILCGIPVQHLVKNELEISTADVELIEQLLQAMIGYWTAIGSSSIEGFRGNWLIRDGLLTEQDDKWELVIEKRAYDLLINQSPFTFSVIKYPWMTKPLYVQWPH